MAFIATWPPQAQLNIGAAREKQSDFSQAVKAYEKAADIYHDKEKVAADALYKSGQAYTKQAKTAEYETNAATKAIEAFSSFLCPLSRDKRAAEVDKNIGELRTEQASGALKIARFYEKNKHWDGALVYYNEVLIRDPKSKFGQEAKARTKP